MTQTTVAVTPVQGRNFRRGVASAKQMAGKYDGAVWHIAADRPELGNLAAYGLRLVQKQARCPHYTVDQGCPLHGETCR